VTKEEIEAADWSLAPSRYVGVAPPEADAEFDFEQTLRDIHAQLADLNKEAAGLATKIEENFKVFGHEGFCEKVLARGTLCTIVSHSAFGPRFSGSAYGNDGNIAT